MLVLPKQGYKDTMLARFRTRTLRKPNAGPKTTENMTYSLIFTKLSTVDYFAEPDAHAIIRAALGLNKK